MMSERCPNCDQRVWGDHNCVVIGPLTFTYSKIGNFDADVDVTFTEHSPDPYYRDSETSYPIDADDARRIIDFLDNSLQKDGTE